MTLEGLVKAVILKATGKATILSPTDPKYQKILGIANAYIDTWQHEYGVDWASLYSPSYAIGTVTAAAKFEIPSDVRKFSDSPDSFVTITSLDGRKTKYTIVPAETLNRYTERSLVCARTGQYLTFTKSFSESGIELGGAISAPCFTNAPYLLDPTDKVPVDIPRWLVIMSAAEYVRNDITKQNQYSNLVGEAMPLMDKMIENNDAHYNETQIAWRPNTRTF